MQQEVENMKWYVLRVMGGKERKTVDFLEKEIDRLGMQDFVAQILVPTEKVYQIRNGKKMGHTQLMDTMVQDGLLDAFNGYHMGCTAENIAEKWQISREEQDEFAVRSQHSAEAAQKSGRFSDEIVSVPVKTKKGRINITEDEFPKHGTTKETLANLKPVYSKNGSVTAGNSSGINDGAAAVVLMTAEEAATRKIKPLARIVSWAQAGVDPSVMGTGPIPASQSALSKAGWDINELD